VILLYHCRGLGSETAVFLFLEVAKMSRDVHGALAAVLPVMRYAN